MFETRSHTPKGLATKAVPLAPGLPTHDTALLLVTHGHATGRAFLEARAATLARCNHFEEVQGAALNGEPNLEKVVSSLTASQIYVAPALLCAGATYKDLARRLENLDTSAEITLCPPLGENPKLAEAIEELAHSHAKERSWPIAQTALVLVGHGSRRFAASRREALRLCEKIKARQSFHEVRTAFLEEGIPLDEILQDLKSGHGIVAGLFAERGGHATHDVPKLIAKSGMEVSYLGPVCASEWADKLLLESALRIARTSQVSGDIKKEA